MNYFNYIIKGEYYSMGKIYQNKITELCFLFRKIIKQNKVLLIIQIIIGLLLLDSVFWVTFTSIHFLHYITMILLLGEIIVTIVLRNSVGNIVGLCTDILIIPLLFVFNQAEPNTLLLVFLSVVVHFFRISSHLAEKQLKNIYGYPGFHDFFINNESETDNDLLKRISEQYTAVSQKGVIQFEMALQKASVIVKMMIIFGIAFFSIGLYLFSSNFTAKKNFENAKIPDSLKYCSDNEYVKCSLKKIFTLSSVGDKFTSDIYWIEFCDETVTFSVSDKFKKQFAKLYNYCIGKNESGDEENFYEGYYDVKEKSSDTITCVGKVHIEKEKSAEINTEVFKSDKPDNLNDGMYIEIVDKNKFEKYIDAGIIISVTGLILIVAGLLIIHKSYKYL